MNLLIQKRLSPTRESRPIRPLQITIMPRSGAIGGEDHLEHRPDTLHDAGNANVAGRSPNPFHDFLPDLV